MKNIMLAIVCGIAVAACAGCGTVKGLGQDVSTVGNWFVKSSDSVKEGAVKEDAPR